MKTNDIKIKIIFALSCIFILLFPYLLGSYNIQNDSTKVAFGDIYFGMNKKDVRLLQYNDTLFFDDFYFIVDVNKSIFDRNNELVILSLKYDSFKKITSDNYFRLVRYMFLVFSSINYECLYLNDYFDNPEKTLSSGLIFSFKNEYKTITLVNSGSAKVNNYGIPIKEYFIELSITSNTYYNMNTFEDNILLKDIENIKKQIN